MLFLILALTGPPWPTATEGADAAPSTRDMIRLHMSEHLARALSASHAVVMGDLTQARADLSWMADHQEPEPVLEAGTAAVDALHAAARQGVAGSTVTDYAAAVGKMGAACGSCHSQNAAGLSPLVATQPKNAAGHEALSSWIVSSMWTGLVANNAETWNSAANGLGSLPNFAGGYGVKGKDARADAAVSTLVSAVKTAPAAADRDARADAYGKVIGACGSCHMAAVKPK